MFRALKNLLEGPAESGSASEQRHLQVAVAVLLNEARRADYDEGDAEWAIAEEALCDLFGISTDESTEILKEGHARQQQLSSLYAPVATIKRHWGMTERIRLVEHLWRVVFADGLLNPYEDHCVRKVAHLLHLSNTDSMVARNRAKAMLT
jgi:uncharacterized tellurite resistance protein B-like protein